MAYGFNDDKSKFNLDMILGDFATVETGSTASKAYDPGDYLVYNNVLHMVIASIAQGSAFVVNTNIVARVGILDEMQKWYKLPVTINVPYTGLSAYCYLIINPLMKLMNISVGFTNNTASSQSDAGVIVKDLPIIKPFENQDIESLSGPANFRKIVFTGMNDSNVIKMALGEIRNYNDAGQLPMDASDWTHARIHGASSIERDIQYSGSILLPYTKLSAAHPFSEAELITL